MEDDLGLWPVTEIVGDATILSVGGIVALLAVGFVSLIRRLAS